MILPSTQPSSQSGLFVCAGLLVWLPTPGGEWVQPLPPMCTLLRLGGLLNTPVLCVVQVYNFNIGCGVRRKPAKLNLNLKGEGYMIHSK